MRVLSQIAEKGEPRFLQAAQADYWFWQRGYEVVRFNAESLRAGDFDVQLTTDIESTIVFASVSTVLDAIVRAGRPLPENLDFPKELTPFLGRRLRELTMGQVRNWESTGADELPVHVKPQSKHKLFTGKIVHHFRDFISLSGVPDEEPVVVQDLIPIVSEWRVTVLRGDILSVAHYKGDPVAFPDPTVIQDALSKFKSAPIAYGMDWAVTESGETLLVEVNDGFALGNYGVRGSQYTAAIESRWRQLMGLKDNGVGL